MEKEKACYSVVLGQMDMNKDTNDPQPLALTAHNISWEWILGLREQTYKQNKTKNIQLVECLYELWVSKIFLEQ